MEEQLHTYCTHTGRHCTHCFIVQCVNTMMSTIQQVQVYFMLFYFEKNIINLFMAYFGQL
jgi:hypothetical protein